MTLPITKAALTGQIDAWQGGRPLPCACLQGPGLEEEEGWRAVIHLVRYRSGGAL